MLVLLNGMLNMQTEERVPTILILTLEIGQNPAGCVRKGSGGSRPKRAKTWFTESLDNEDNYSANQHGSIRCRERRAVVGSLLLVNDVLIVYPLTRGAETCIET